MHRQYYKPWEFLPGDEEKVKAQVQEAEEIIEKETTQWDEGHPATDPEPPPDRKTEPPETKEATHIETDTVGSATNGEKSSTPVIAEDTNVNGTATSNDERKTAEPPEASKDQADDAGEVVEGEEDTVIY